MSALAGDEMRGRGSATADELRAAEYIASQLKALKDHRRRQRRISADREVSTRTARRSARRAGNGSDDDQRDWMIRGSDQKLSNETFCFRRT
jgi:hypothetical protein